MKSKITKIQKILTKGIAIFAAGMMLASPMVYAVTSLDDSYLESSWLDKLLYGSIGSTANEIAEHFNSGETTLYITNETQLRALAEYVNDGNSCDGKQIILLNDIEVDKNNEWIPIGNEEKVFDGKFNFNGYMISGLPDLTEEQDSIIDVIFGGTGNNSIIIEGTTTTTQIEKVINEEKDLKATYEIPEGYFNGPEYKDKNNNNKTDENEKIEAERDATITVKVTFNQKLYTRLGNPSDTPVTNTTAPKLSMTLKDDDNEIQTVDLTTDSTDVNENDNTTTINYTLLVTDDTTNGQVEAFNLSSSSTYYYAVSGAKIDSASQWDSEYGIASSDFNKDISWDRIYIDTEKPTINTKVYVENMLKEERYTAGKEILFEVTTSEAIQGFYEIPRIQVSFSESGIGKYNYSKEEKNAGFAKCKEAKINFDGITTWIYSYQVQERDEGFVDFDYVAGKIYDLADNETDIVKIYTADENVKIEGTTNVSGKNWNNNLGVIFKFYKNNKNTPVEVDTFFTTKDQLIIEAEFDKILYAVAGKINTTEITRALTESKRLPHIYLNGIDKMVNSSASITGYNKIEYRFNISDYDFLDNLTRVTKITLKNDNNDDKFEIENTEVYGDGSIPFHTEYDSNYRVEGNDNILVKDAKLEVAVENIQIDPENVSETIVKTDIYADTTAPTVTITANKSNPTNANEILYTFEFSEIVEGFTADDITVNNGVKVTEKVIVDEEEVEQPIFEVVEEGRKYTLLVKPTTTEGNEGILQVIVEEGAAKDLVAINNVRQEMGITIDKERPTFTSYEIDPKEGVTNQFEITATFSEAISDASDLKPTLKVGGEDAQGIWEDVEIYDSNKVRFVYIKDPNDGGKVEVTLDGTVKDVAGNDSEKLNIQIENDITLVQNVIKNGNDSYSFFINDKPINDFTERTYFKKEDTITVIKTTETEVEGEIQKEEVEYSYTLGEEDENKYNGNYMKYMKLNEETEESEATVILTENKKSGSVNIERANIYYDTTSPKVLTEITANNPVENNVYGEGAELTIKATTSEEVSKYEIPVINVVFGENTGKFNDGKAEYIQTIENEDGTSTAVYRYLISVGDEGEVSLSYANGKVIDLAGNSTTLTNLNSEEGIFVLNEIKADTTIPTLEITSDVENPTNADKIVYTFEFSEVVDGFTADDITVNNANKGKFVEVTKGEKYTLEVEPIITAGNEGDVQVIVEQNACIDKVGLGNVRQENIIKVDKKLPTVEIKANKDYVQAGEIIEYTFTWSEKIVTTFKEGVIVENGEIVNEITKVNDNDLQYTMGIKPTNGNDVKVKILNGTTKDIAGNENIGAEHTIAVAPSVIIKTNVENPTNESTITYTFEWSEPVTGFDISDIILPNGVEGTLSGNTMTIDYNGVIALGNEGEVTVAVKENAAQDANGNQNAYASNTTKIDRIAPIFIGLESYAESTIKLDSNVDTVKQYYKAGDKVTIVATFTENVEKSTAPALALQFSESGNALGTVSAGIIAGNKITYTYTITDGDLGTISVKGFSGKVVDAAGNETVVTKRTLTGDTIIADTINPELVGITAIAPDFEYDELLQDGETKRYGVTSKTRENNTITIIAEYSENVYSLNSNTINKITNVPKLTIKIGTSDRIITTGTVEGNKITYTYAITDLDDGILSIKSLTGTVYDIAGNNCETSTISSDKVKYYESSISDENEVDAIEVDTTSTTIGLDVIAAINKDPKANTITGNDKYYREGSIITVTVTSKDEYIYNNTDKQLTRINKDIANEKKPTIKFGNAVGKGTFNEEATTVKYENDSTIITYEYVVASGDNGAISLYFNADVYSDIALNGNSSAEDNSTTKKVEADTIAPYIAENTNGIAQWTIASTDTSITATGVFSEILYVMNDQYKLSKLANSTDAPTMGVFADGKLVGGATAKINNNNGKTTLTYTYNTSKIDADTISVNIIDGTLYDRAGNEWSLEIDSDTASPKFNNIQVLTKYGHYKKDEKIEIIARFYETTKLTTTPTLNIKIGEKAIPLQGNVIADDELNTSISKVVRYSYTIVDENGPLNIVSLEGYVSDGTRTAEVSRKYIKTSETDVLASANEIKNSDGNLYRVDVSNDKGVFADTINPYITSVIANIEEKDEPIEIYRKEDGKDAVTKVSRVNVNEIEYIVTFSEPVPTINKNNISITNGIINNEDIQVVENTNHTQYKIKVQTTVEGVQSLIIANDTVRDRAGNANILERFNLVTADFTVPTVRFISENNGGIYVIPTSIEKVEIRPNVEINEDISKIEYNWDNGDYAVIDKYSGASDIVVPTKEFTEAGEYTLYIRVTDIAGNTTVASKEYTVKVSRINLVPSETEATNQDVLVTVEFEDGLTDNRKVAFKAEGSNEYKEINPETNGYRITENGTVYAEATDKVGNKVYNELLIDNIDKVAPEVKLDLYSANLVIGTGKDKATIKTGLEVKDENSVEIKYIYSNNGTITDEEKAAMKSLNNYGEAKIEDATEGTYYLHVIAVDSAGNETVVKSSEFIVANSNIVKDEEGNVTFTPAEENTITFTREQQFIDVNFGMNLTENQEITFTNKDDGYALDGYAQVLKPTTVTAKASDVCGNTVTATYVVESVEGPEFEVTGNPKGWTNQDVKLEVVSYDELKALTVNGTDILSSKEYVVAENGDYEFIATDIFGNISKQTIKVTKIDKVLPVISKVENAGKDITITSTDELSGVKEYAITLTTEVPVEWSESNVIKTTKDGTFYVWAKDNAGNIVRAENTITVDTTAPTVTFSYTTLSVNVGETLKADVITNENAKIEYYWSWASTVKVEGEIDSPQLTEQYSRNISFSKENTKEGIYKLNVKAIDEYGNTSELQVLEFNVIEKIEDIEIPEIIFEDLPTIQVDGVQYVKVAADMTAENITEKMDKEALLGKTPEYTKLTEDKNLKTGSEITLDGETKYIIVVNGDINCDGEVTFDDIIKTNAVRISATEDSITKAQLLAVDINNTAKIEFKDIISINAIRINSAN